ncbi:hypothetical protein CONLIGDRAFT_464768 [Coniochaeta ligniaria NRRL 30616]|uniref:Uncharacterized protein n=1 Tax=Coniochaeta ligniaria NRRL 30616 TaxID=1408157 RepID=A0A1J7ILL8_9PEZI|nr:hypothetical protein CONLIGDRAFT_464768 [Coniochaeta ligniaria NRRL 30616]
MWESHTSNPSISNDCRWTGPTGVVTDAGKVQPSLCWGGESTFCSFHFKVPYILDLVEHKPHLLAMAVRVAAARAAARVLLAPSRLSSVHSRTGCLPRAMSTVVETSSILPSTPPPPPPPSHLPQQSQSSTRPGEIEADQAAQDAAHAQRQQRAKRILQDAVAATAPRHNWTKEEIAAIYYQPLMELAFQAVRIYTPST